MHFTFVALTDGAGYCVMEILLNDGKASLAFRGAGRTGTVAALQSNSTVYSKICVEQ